jgi:hypothetical protein
MAREEELICFCADADDISFSVQIRIRIEEVLRCAGSCLGLGAFRMIDNVLQIIRSNSNICVLKIVTS